MRLLAIFGLVALGGCSALLPRSRAEDISPFQSYDAAREALESVVPYRTTLEGLKMLGFDVQASANVQQVPYPQWVAVLAHPNVPLDRAPTSWSGRYLVVIDSGRAERPDWSPLPARW